MYVQAKLNMRALLDQVFPAYEGVFYELYIQKTALRILQQYLGGVVITEDTIRETARKSHGQAWIRKKATHLQSITPSKGQSRAQTIALQSMLGLLLTFQEQLYRLEQRIE